MFGQFTDRARKVMGLARQDAQARRHEYIGVEHILVGISAEERGVAALVLRGMGVTTNDLRAEFAKLEEPGAKAVVIGQSPFTPRAKRALERASDEERAEFGHHYVGTEHLLLGLLWEQDSPAAKVIAHFGYDREHVRNRVADELGDQGESTDPVRASVETTVLPIDATDFFKRGAVPGGARFDTDAVAARANYRLESLVRLTEAALRGPLLCAEGHSSHGANRPKATGEWAAEIALAAWERLTKGEAPPA